ncbi:MAG TPA: ABC transporter permease [Pirellulales bacterium]
MSGSASSAGPVSSSGGNSPADRPLIQLSGVKKIYGEGDYAVHALRGLDLTIEQGDYVALVGQSGSGKSTLMNILGCLDPATAGDYWLNGQNVAELSSDELSRLRGRTIGFVFQAFNLLPRTAAIDNVLMPTNYVSALKSADAVEQRARRLLERVGLGKRLDHHPSKLSGGQQQRVAIARSLINEPRLLLADEPTGNLDSDTTQEILGLLTELNDKEGVTVVLVTHDKRVAQAAARVIELADGRVIDDHRNRPHPRAALGGPAVANRPALAEAAHSSSGRGSLGGLGLRGWWNTVAIAGSALRRNMLRSLLTMLGVIIGIAAVILMVEISQGTTNAISETVSKMGANIVLVLPSAPGEGAAGAHGPGITADDAQAIATGCPAVLLSAPIVRAKAQVVAGNRTWAPLNLFGTTPEMLTAREWDQTAAGRAFTANDVRRGAQVCLLGRTVADALFERRDPVGQELRIGNVPFRVAGVLEAKGANVLGVDQDDIVLAPWTTVAMRLSGGTRSTSPRRPTTYDPRTPQVYQPDYPGDDPLSPAQALVARRTTTVDQILVKARTAEQVPEALAQIEELLRSRHRLPPGAVSDFRVRNMTEATETLNKIMLLLTVLLLAGGAISLIVGGVGIMNVMLVSVVQRTREIGIRRAVGATSSAVLRQFLVEAVVLCLIGGAMGILLGLGIGALLPWLFNLPTEPSWQAIVVAFAVSFVVGLGFGWYPAREAAKLDPIQALRYE